MYMGHKIASGTLNYNFAKRKLKWHKNPEKRCHEKKLGDTLKQNKTGSQSKRICVALWKEEGRVMAVSKWWVECLKIHMELIC